MAPQDIVFGCVTDRSDRRFLDQAVRLVASLRWFGGSLARSRFIVCSVDGLPEAYADALGRLDAELRPAERFDARHGASNKLRFLELPELTQYDAVALLDCDTLIVQDPAAYMPESGFAARLAGYLTVKPDIYVRMVEHFGLPVPPMDCRSDVSGRPMHPYFNSGVCIFARDTFPVLKDAWLKWNRTLLGEAEAVGFPIRFTDQMSLALALIDTRIEAIKLPSAMNFPTHYGRNAPTAHFYDTDPVIVHYHAKGRPGGGIAPLAMPKAQNRAREFNRRFAEAALLPKEAI